MESGSWPLLINDWLVSSHPSHPWFLDPTIGRLWSRAPGPDSSQQCTSDPPRTVQQSWIGRVRPSFQQRPDMSVDDRLVMWVDLYRLIMLQCSGTFLARFIYIFHTPHPCASNLGAPKVPGNLKIQGFRASYCSGSASQCGQIYSRMRIFGGDSP